MNLEIHGAALECDQKVENIVEVLRDIAGKIGIDFGKTSIQKAHRLQQRKDGEPPKILVQFYCKGERDAWLFAGKASKLPGIFFSENFCPYYRRLLWDTKVKAKTYESSYVWWQGGKILVRPNEGTENILVLKNRRDSSKLSK